MSFLELEPTAMDTKSIESQLRPNHAGALVLDTGETINYGVIEVGHGKLKYYTGKGLREIWSPRMSKEQASAAAILKEKSEEELISSEHIAVISLERIVRVLF